MYITSTGMVCPVGRNAAAACAAMRAGIAKFDELPYLDSRIEPIIGAAVPSLDDGLRRYERVAALLSGAVADCLGETVPDMVAEVPLLVGLAEPGRPGGSAEMADAVVREMRRQLGLSFHPRLSRAFTLGHTSGFHAVRYARELLQEAHAPACLVCGVDSYINARSLRWLERHGRLKTAENSDGVIPGEAAAAVMIHPRLVRGQGALVEVIGLGFAHEAAGVLSEEPLLAPGLTAAARAALAEARVGMHDIDFRLSDVTGERYGFKEHALALTRLLRRRREDVPLWHCADSIGDTGAAAGICQLVIACHAFLKCYAPGNFAIGFTSAVLGDRAVIVLKRQDE